MYTKQVLSKLFERYSMCFRCLHSRRVNERLNINNNDLNDSGNQFEYTAECEAKHIGRGVAKTYDEYLLRKRLTVSQPEMPRLARVAVIGAPNAGKSTLTNELVGWHVSGVSKKVHTTRHKIVGVMVEDDTQVEFLDTPGLVTPKHCSKHSLEQSFLSDPLRCVRLADIIAVTADVSNSRDRERLNLGVINILHKCVNKETILILNKIDTIKEKRKLLDITTRLTCGVVGGVCSVSSVRRPIVNQTSATSLEKIFNKTRNKMQLNSSCETNENENEKEEEEEEEEEIGWPHFNRVFMVSALSGDGVEDLRKYLLQKAKFHPWVYHKSQVTDQTPNELLYSTLRGKCLDLMPQEIPYKINFSINVWEMDKTETLYIAVNLLCPKRFVSMLIGPKGRTVAQIAKSSRETLSNIFQCEVSLRLIVKTIQKS